MTKYVEAIAGLFSHLEIQQFDSYTKKLYIDQIKIMHSEILPAIKDLDRRRELKKILTEREKQLYAGSEKEAVIKNELEKYKTVSDQLQAVYEDLTKDVLLGLNNKSTRELLLKRATGDELLVLERRLMTMSFDETVEALQVDLDAEKRHRKNNPEQKDAYKETQRTVHTNLQWESGIWQNIINNSNQIKLELHKPPVKNAIEAPKREPSILSTIGSFLANGAQTLTSGFAKVLFFTMSLVPYVIGKGIYKLFGSDTPKPEPKEIKSVPDEISEEERAVLDRLRLKGAQSVAKATGLTKVGGEKKRDQASIESSLHTRFGMVLASQMVAGTKNAHHRDLNTVIESLVRKDDDDTIELVQNAIKGALDDSDANPLKGEHACSTGGDADLVTAMESGVIGKLVRSPDDFEQYGLNLTKTEKEQLNVYYQNMNRTRDLSHLLKEVGSDWGGYAPTDPKNGEPKDSYKKVEHEFDKKQKIYEDKLSLASRALQESIKNLKDGESLYLETGLEGHAMQLVIKKEGGNVKLSTYDSSGALENTALLNGGVSNIKNGRKGFWNTIANVGLWPAITDLFSSGSGVYHLWRMGTESMRKNALTFSVPQERLNSSEGVDYLSTLIRSNSMAGWAQTHIDLKLKHTTMEERSHMGYFERLSALNAQSDVYSNYIKNFSSIASDGALPEFQDLLQRPQNTQNCFAKKAQSCELYELGKGTYKKVRQAMLVEQKEAILN